MDGRRRTQTSIGVILASLLTFTFLYFPLATAGPTRSEYYPEKPEYHGEMIDRTYKIGKHADKVTGFNSRPATSEEKIEYVHFPFSDLNDKKTRLESTLSIKSRTGDNSHGEVTDALSIIPPITPHRRSLESWLISNLVQQSPLRPHEKRFQVFKDNKGKPLNSFKEYSALGESKGSRSGVDSHARSGLKSAPEKVLEKVNLDSDGDNRTPIPLPSVRPNGYESYGKLLMIPSRKETNRDSPFVKDRNDNRSYIFSHPGVRVGLDEGKKKGEVRPRSSSLTFRGAGRKELKRKLDSERKRLAGEMAVPIYDLRPSRDEKSDRDKDKTFGTSKLMSGTSQIFVFSTDEAKMRRKSETVERQRREITNENKRAAADNSSVTTEPQESSPPKIDNLVNTTVVSVKKERDEKEPNIASDKNSPIPVLFSEVNNITSAIENMTTSSSSTNTNSGLEDKGNNSTTEKPATLGDVGNATDANPNSLPSLFGDVTTVFPDVGTTGAGGLPDLGTDWKWPMLSDQTTGASMDDANEVDIVATSKSDREDPSNQDAGGVKPTYITKGDDTVNETSPVKSGSDQSKLNDSLSTEPEPEPEPEPTPEPTSKPEPTATATPETSPEPTPNSTPESTPEPKMGRVEEPTAEPTPESSPEPTAESVSTSPYSPEPGAETSPKPESTTETSIEPEPKSVTSIEPEPEPEPSAEPKPEPEPEPEGDAPSAEPSPEWDYAKELWQEAWEVHIYGFGGLFAAVGAYSLISLVRLWRIQRLLSKPYFISLNLLMLLMCATRSFYLLYDPYNSGGTFPISLDYFLYSISFPCVTSAFSVLLYSLLKATHMQLVSPSVQRLPVLTFIVISHFVLSIATDVLLGLYAGMQVMLFVCQVYFILWGLFLFFGYAHIFRKIYAHAVKRQKHLYDQSGGGSGGASGLSGSRGSSSSSSPKSRYTLSTAIKVTFFTAICGLITVALEVYAIVEVYKTFTRERPKPWPWWLYHTVLRIIEFLMCLTMSYVASQPFRYKSGSKSNSSSGGGCCSCCSCGILCAPCAEIVCCGHTINKAGSAAGWSEIEFQARTLSKLPNFKNGTRDSFNTGSTRHLYLDDMTDSTPIVDLQPSPATRSSTLRRLAEENNYVHLNPAGDSKSNTIPNYTEIYPGEDRHIHTVSTFRLRDGFVNTGYASTTVGDARKKSQINCRSSTNDSVKNTSRRNSDSSNDFFKAPSSVSLANSMENELEKVFESFRLESSMDDDDGDTKSIDLIIASNLPNMRETDLLSVDSLPDSTCDFAQPGEISACSEVRGSSDAETPVDLSTQSSEIDSPSPRAQPVVRRVRSSELDKPHSQEPSGDSQRLSRSFSDKANRRISSDNSYDVKYSSLLEIKPGDNSCLNTDGDRSDFESDSRRPKEGQSSAILTSLLKPGYKEEVDI